MENNLKGIRFELMLLIVGILLVLISLLLIASGSKITWTIVALDVSGAILGVLASIIMYVRK